MCGPFSLVSNCGGYLSGGWPDRFKGTLLKLIILSCLGVV